MELANKTIIITGASSATFLAGDVRDAGYAAGLVEHAIASFGKLDGAFNNAGVVVDMMAVPEMRVENWTDVAPDEADGQSEGDRARGSFSPE